MPSACEDVVRHMPPPLYLKGEEGEDHYICQPDLDEADEMAD